VEFLVHMTLRWPDSMEDAARNALTDAEAVRARELADEGRLLKLWRAPGQRANWGVWSAPDAEALHAALTSLPLWPWCQVTVHPLARHPNDPVR
jgi:muconolactone D-isomerase